MLQVGLDLGPQVLHVLQIFPREMVGLAPAQCYSIDPATNGTILDAALAWRYILFEMHHIGELKWLAQENCRSDARTHMLVLTCQFVYGGQSSVTDT